VTLLLHDFGFPDTTYRSRLALIAVDVPILHSVGRPMLIGIAGGGQRASRSTADLVELGEVELARLRD
jgi:hypothetical protein